LAWLALLGAACSAESANSAGATAPTYAPPRAPIASSVTSALAPEPVALEKAQRAPAHVVLVTLDGVRWQDVARSLDSRDGAPSFPCLHQQVAKWGTAVGLGKSQCGTVTATGPAFVSLPGYREILSGHPSSCGSNSCPPLRRPTLFDARHEAGVPKGELVSVASWDGLTSALTKREGTLTILAGAKARAPELEAHDPVLRELLDTGARNAGFPGTGSAYRPDAHTMEIGLHVWNEVRPRLLHIGLGDADEYGHRTDLTRYHQALKRSDRLFCELGEQLTRDASAASDPSPSLVLVTTDHGRGANFRDHGAAFPESARSFVVAFGSAVGARGASCSRESYALADIAPTLARVLDVPMDRGRDGVVGKPMEALLGAPPSGESEHGEELAAAHP